MDKFRALHVFAEVVERGSFSAAADQLDISRTAASRLVMDLEAELGTALLTRTTRRLSLTAVGSSYYADVRAILDRLDDADQNASAAALVPRGRVRVAVPMSFGMRHIATHIAELMTLYEELQIDLVLGDRMVDLVSEGFDCAVRIGDLGDSSLMARRVGLAQVLLCAAPAYLKRAGTPSVAADLASHVCLGFPYRSGGNAWHLEHRTDGAVVVPVTNKLWSNNGDALSAASCAGAGIILQPDFIVADALASGALVEILTEYSGPTVPISIVFPAAQFRPLRARIVIDFLAEKLRARFGSSKAVTI